jgi:hypothetical protein
MILCKMVKFKKKITITNLETLAGIGGRGIEPFPVVYSLAMY